MSASRNETVRSGSVAIHCAVDDAAGPQAPWLVFSNSLMTDLGLWDDQAAAFASRFRILRYDQRGHGRTTVPGDACTFEVLSRDLAVLFDAFSIATATLVGVSMGGITALRFAIDQPGRLDRLVVCDCTGAASPGADRLWDDRIAEAGRDGMEVLVEPTVGRWFTPASLAADRPAITRVRQMIANTPVLGFARAAQALRFFDLSPGLPGIHVPTLMLAGAGDGALPEAMRAMSGLVPGARFTLIEGAGHLPNIERPEAFHRALADLLSS